MNNYKILKNLDNVKKGKIGEEIARRYLVLIGMKIICSNYKTKFGEIDIIAKLENKIVFIEVKSRTSKDYGLAAPRVSARRAAMRTAAKL